MRRASWVIGLLIANLGSGLAVVEAKHEARALQNELQQRRVERDDIETEWSQLQLEESAWANHGRIEEIARGPLNMREPETYVIVMESN